MNPGLTIEFWGGLFGTLALEAAVLVGLAALASRFYRSQGIRLAFWQVAILGLGGLVLCEVTGLETPKLWASKPVEFPPIPRAPVTLVAESEPDAFPTESMAVETPVTPSKADAPVPRPPSFHRWPLALWILGSISLAAGSLSARLGVGWRARKLQPVSEGSLVRRLEEIRVALGFSRPIQLLRDERLRGPVAFGVWRPTIVLPADFADRFSGAQQSAMLAHEIAHLAGRDPLWMALADLAAALWWWHPMAWWARRQLRLQSELAADHASAVVDNGPTALAESLVILGRELARRRGWLGGMAVEGGGFRSDLARRVTQLLSVSEGVPVPVPGSGWRWGGRAAALALVVGIALGPWPWTEARSIRPAASSIVAATLKSFMEQSRLREGTLVAAPSTGVDLLGEAREFLRQGELGRAREALNQAVSREPSRNGAGVLLARLDQVAPAEGASGAPTVPASAPDRSRLERIVVRGFGAPGASTLGHSLRRLLGAVVLSDADLADLQGLRFSFVAPTSPAGTDPDAPRPSPESIAVLSEKGFPKESTFLAALDSILGATLSKVRPVYRLEGNGIAIEVPVFTPPLAQRDVRELVVRMGLAPAELDSVSVLQFPWKADAGLNSFAVTGAEVRAISPSWLRPSNSTYVALDTAGGSSRSPLATAAVGQQVGSRASGPSVESTAKSLTDAKLFLEMGRFSEARAKIVGVLKDDPENPAARELLARVNTASVAAQADPATAAVPPSVAVRPISETGRVRIAHDLDSIRLQKFQAAAGTKLGEVLRRLDAAARAADPKGTGINLLWNVATGPKPAVDPTTGIAAPESVDVSAPEVALAEPLSVSSGSTVRAAIEAILHAATVPIGYRVEDYAVVLERWDPDAPAALRTRRFKTDPRPFLAGLEAGFGGIGGIGGADDTTDSSTNRTMPSVQVQIRELFQSVGIGFPSPATNGPTSIATNSPAVEQKALFYNDRTGVLFVRATLEDLDRVEEVIQRLSPGSVDAGDALAARRDYATALERLEVDRGRYRSRHPRLEEDLRLVRTRRMRMAAVEAALASAPSAGPSRTLPPPTEPSVTPPPPPPPGPPASMRLQVKVAAITERDSGALGLDWLFGEAVSKPNTVTSRAFPPDLLPGGTPISPNVRVDSTASEGEVVALRPDQARALMEKLRSLDQVDLLSAPVVTTAPSREAQVAVQQVQTIVTGMQTNQPPGSTNAFLTETIPLGLSVTLRPEWLGSGWRIAAKGRVTEFLGYDDPGQKGGGGGKRSTEPTVPLPHLAIRELRATGEVHNGSSLLIRGPLTESRVIREEGRVFKKKVETVKRTRLLMIVTPEE